MNRRELLLGLGSAPLLLSFPRLASSSEPGFRFLVLIELSGGNDALNMVVPYADAAYYRLRPNLGVNRDEVLQINPRLGLNPAMKSLWQSFQEKDLAIVQGVGYAQPTRSHFRSIEIWDTATDAELVSNDGWLTRLGATPFADRNLAADAVVIGRNPRPVEGGQLKTLVMMVNPGLFAKSAARLQGVDAVGLSPALRHIIDVNQQIIGSAPELNAGSRPRPLGAFPLTEIGKNLEYTARLMMGQPAAGIIKLTHPGFDTHVGQRKLQDRLLTELSDGLSAFSNSLKLAGLWDRTLVMTYSEFGRRAAENGNNGTDHGAAAAHLIMGGTVKGGVYGEQPSLNDLDSGDLKYTVDFRSLYNTVLSRWWGRRSNLFEVSKYPVIDFV